MARMATTTEDLQIKITAQIAQALQELAKLKKVTEEIAKDNTGLIRTFSDLKDGYQSALGVIQQIGQAYMAVMKQSGLYRYELKQLHEKMELFKTAAARPVAQALHEIANASMVSSNQVANAGTILGKVFAGAIKLAAKLYEWILACWTLPVKVSKFLGENIAALSTYFRTGEKGFKGWSEAQKTSLLFFEKDLMQSLNKQSNIRRTYSEEEERANHKAAIS